MLRGGLLVLSQLEGSSWLVASKSGDGEEGSYTLVVTEAAVLDGTMQLYCKEMYRRGAQATCLRYQRRRKMDGNLQDDGYFC